MKLTVEEKKDCLIIRDGQATEYCRREVLAGIPLVTVSATPTTTLLIAGRDSTDIVFRLFCGRKVKKTAHCSITPMPDNDFCVSYKKTQMICGLDPDGNPLTSVDGNLISVSGSATISKKKETMACTLVAILEGGDE